MRCPLYGELQAFIDGETDDIRSKEIEEHLLGCQKCRDDYNELLEINHFTNKKLEIYNKAIDADDVIDITVKKFQDTTKNSKFDLRRVGINYMIKNKRILASTCAVLILTLCISVQPVRAAISNALSIFRVENVKSIGMTVEDLTKLQREISSHKAQIDLDKLGKINTTGGETVELSPGEINKLTDFKVLLPSMELLKVIKTSSITPAHIQFDLNITNTNNLLTSLGAEPGKLLPTNLDGKSFSIDLPRTVNVDYDLNGKNINLIETQSPQLQVPAGVDVDEIYNAMIELPILPDNLQKQLRSIKDWKNTIYVPVVKSQMEEVDINGARGYVSDNGILGDLKNSQRVNKSSNSSFVIWFKDKVFYEVCGNASKEELINIAKSMR